MRVLCGLIVLTVVVAASPIQGAKPAPGPVPAAKFQDSAIDRIRSDGGGAYATSIGLRFATGQKRKVFVDLSQRVDGGGTATNPNFATALAEGNFEAQPRGGEFPVGLPVPARLRLWFTPGQQSGSTPKWRLEWPFPVEGESTYTTVTNLGNGTWIVEAPVGASAYLTDNQNNWAPAGTYQASFRIVFENMAF